MSNDVQLPPEYQPHCAECGKKISFDSRWDISLEFGKIAERKLYCILTAPISPLSERLRVEVKSDTMAHETGNLYIEYESRDRKSGLAQSTAEWWVFDLAGFRRGRENPNPTVFLFFETEELKARLRAMLKAGLAKKVKGGDIDPATGEETSTGLLVNIRDLLRMV